MRGQTPDDPATWRPQDRLVASIASMRQLRAFNDAGGIAVNFDVMRARAPDIAITGSQSATLSLWETRSASGFVTKPKFHAELVTIRFVTEGQILYRHGGGLHRGSPTHATLVGFEDLAEVEASERFGALSATVALRALVAANDALNRGHHRGLPPFAPVAEVDTPGMMALFCTMRQVQHRIGESDRQADLILPLLQEILSYQLLSAWPRRSMQMPAVLPDVGPGSLRLALDYIEANLSTPLTLAVIARAAGISVRALQDKFRRDVGRTPVQFITERRLARAHADLLSARHTGASIAEIARRWGFVHMGDFGQRYRRRYGCAPSETRRESWGHMLS